MNRNTLYRIHVWLSIPLGIVITLICLSGATLVFKQEIRNALGMPQVVSPHVVSKTLAADTALVVATKHHHANAQHGITTKRDFFSYVTRFHTSLFLGSGGKLLVTYVTLFFIAILASGVWMCWPKNGSQWRRRFTISRGNGTFRLLYDLHVSLGFYLLLWLLLLAITGVAFGLHLLPKGSEAMALFHQLHVGKWGGIITKIITFAASLFGATLPLTGYYLFFKKHFANRR